METVSVGKRVTPSYRGCCWERPCARVLGDGVGGQQPPGGCRGCINDGGSAVRKSQTLSVLMTSARFNH